jgi:hypothetical protein
VPQQLTVKGQSRLASHGPGVPDEAVRHCDEPVLAALIIATINIWKRLNLTTKQVAGSVPR